MNEPILLLLLYEDQSCLVDLLTLIDSIRYMGVTDKTNKKMTFCRLIRRRKLHIYSILAVLTFFDTFFAYLYGCFANFTYIRQH